MKSFIWLQTADGSIQEVEEEVAMFCPMICREIVQTGMGSSKNFAITLPPRVNPAILSLILDYCRFHQVPGRSNKVWITRCPHVAFYLLFLLVLMLFHELSATPYAFENSPWGICFGLQERKSFDEKFIRMDTKRLCELTSAADSLQLKPLVDLTSRALARMIEGKTPEEIRETFHLPDDLTEVAVMLMNVVLTSFSWFIGIHLSRLGLFSGRKAGAFEKYSWWPTYSAIK